MCATCSAWTSRGSPPDFTGVCMAYADGQRLRIYRLDEAEPVVEFGPPFIG